MRPGRSSAGSCATVVGRPCQGSGRTLQRAGRGQTTHNQVGTVGGRDGDDILEGLDAVPKEKQCQEGRG